MADGEAPVCALHAAKEAPKPLAVDPLPAAAEHGERADGRISRQKVWQLSGAAGKATRRVLKREDGLDAPARKGSKPKELSVTPRLVAILNEAVLGG